MAALLSLERSLIKPDMSDDEQQLFTMADVGVGLNSIPLLVSGYLRVTRYGKGWDFYQHEPLFWLKLGLVGIIFSASIFVTIKVIQRSVLQAQSGEWPRMTEKLASRIKTLVTAELLALFSIPLAATLMARGVAYTTAIPWQAEAALDGLVVTALIFKYTKEALDFQDDDQEEEPVKGRL